MAPLIDSFSKDEVVRALRTITMSEKAGTLVHALATARNRAMSRLELARTIGSESVNACNATYGAFARNLIIAIDPDSYRPLKKSSGDWVMSISHAPPRWQKPSVGERDTWVFAMSETLARALDAVGFASYQPLDEEVAAHVREYEDSLGTTDASEIEPELDEADPFTPPNPLDEIDAAFEQLGELEETEREAIIMARVGQGIFRKRLLEAWGSRCSVTGVALLPVLVASHIKPWMAATNEERLDPANGLLLVGTLDRLFDTGLITFEDDGAVRISPLVPEADYGALGLTADLRLRYVPQASLPYLAVHRADFFTTEWDQE